MSARYYNAVFRSHVKAKCICASIFFIVSISCCSFAEPKSSGDKSVTASDDVQIIKKMLSQNEPVVWLFAGDSITHGVATNGWRDYVQLFELRIRWELLRKEDIVIKTAASGWIIASLDNRLGWYLEKLSPDIISINFGMNDCVQSLTEPNALKAWKVRFAKVLKNIRDAGVIPILHTPNAMHPHSSSGDVKRRKFLTQYVKVIRELADETKTILIDNYKCWEIYQKKEVASLWMSDDIHPNHYGHRVIAQELFKALDIFDPNRLSCKLVVPRYP